MNYLKKLEELVNKFIEENKKKIDRYNNNCTIETLYKELLFYLKDEPQKIKENKLIISILFDNIYENTIYQDKFYQILINLDIDKKSKNDLKQLISVIENEYSNIKEENLLSFIQIKRTRNLLSSANRVKYSLKYHLPINQDKHDILNIKRIINYYEISGHISEKEEILLINEIESYNKRISVENMSVSEQDYANRLYEEIPNILLAGFQEHDKVEVSKERRQQLDKFVKEITQYIQHIDNSQIIEVLQTYKNYNLDDNEYNYIIIKLLDNYVEELIELYKILIDKEIYPKRSNRLEITKEYYNILEKYLLVLNYYNKTNEYVLGENDNLEEQQSLPDGHKTLIYSNLNITKAKILSDMKELPNEYYEKVYTLLNNFKNNNITNKQIKPLKNKNKEFNGYIELRDDQVRIVVKHIKDNIYCIMGLFVKKSNNDMVMYTNLINRNIPDISTDERLRKVLELSNITEEELNLLIKEKGRKGTR